MMTRKKVGVEDMLSQLQEWHRESTNFRNDGFVQAGYRKKLRILHSQIIRIMDTIETTGDMPSEDKKLGETGKGVWRVSVREDEK
jgi:hypothetical protein